MANSGKNTNTSGFFIVLTEDESKHSKLNGKYVCFGRVLDVEGDEREVLRKVDQVAGDQDTPVERVWISDCGA